MKLHLGCGQYYLEGYVNIDYPSTDHTVMTGLKADQYSDLTSLRYPNQSIDEIRLHHVFEHFSRAIACALLAGWNSWLKTGGHLRIEVPDFEKTGKVALSRFSSEREKGIALRHIFGSQEAHWAIHFEGYTPSSLKNMMKLFGFNPVDVKKNSHSGTYNIDITAEKVKNLSTEEANRAAEKYLRNYMVADVESEQQMLQVWLNDYANQLKKTIALNEPVK